MPTLLVTDLHARPDYLAHALELEMPSGETVFDLLKAGRMNLVCMGDGMHSERFDARWEAIDAAASEDALGGRALRLLDQEMVGTMEMVMDLKNSFPENFHFLRGNHEEVRGRYFFKSAHQHGESSLVRRWMEERLGPGFVDRYAHFEEAMPLMAVGEGFVASHTAPPRPMTAEEIAARDPDARHCLNWTDNSQRDEHGRYQFETPANHQALRDTLANVGAPGARWFIGHKPVKPDEHGGRFRTQFEGQLVQLNNPERQAVALVNADGQFDPERDVRWLD